MKSCKLCYGEHDGAPGERYCPDCALDLEVMGRTIQRRRARAMAHMSYDTVVMVEQSGQIAVIRGTIER